MFFNKLLEIQRRIRFENFIGVIMALLRNPLISIVKYFILKLVNNLKRFGIQSPDCSLIYNPKCSLI